MGTDESFELARPGKFEEIQTTLGEWKTETGSVLVDDKHAKSGKQCLQIAGGSRSSVTLNLKESIDTTGTLSFWAERWTVRKPFSFRIEKDSGQGWQEIFNGDASVRVGRSFLNHVKVKLADAAIQKLRFIVTSPPNTGVLIDNIRIAPLQPQRIVGIEVVPATLPALVGADTCRLVHLKVTTAGEKDPLQLKSVTGKFHGLAELSELHWVTIGGAASSQVLDRPKDGDAWKWELKPIELVEGENHFWLSGKLKKSASIDGAVGASLKQVTFANGQVFKLNSLPSWQRKGVSLRNRGDDNVHTFRIPGLATTNKGTLIGVYDVRHRGGRDLPGDIDVGMSRSTDGGKTWEPMKTIMDMGDDPRWNYDGIGDPSVLVDKNTGTIWVAATWSHGNRSWNGSGPGLSPAETGQFMLVKSEDDGVTWSKPINITKQVKKPEWCFILQGPGKGITMLDGTIVFPAQYQDPPENRRLPHSTIIYSKDHGKTWQVGTGAFDDTTESQVIEVEPGVLMLNCRYNRKSARVVMTTKDMGQTWQKHSTSELSLIEPRACMASLIDVDQELGKNAGGWILFSNPDSLAGRQRMMIKASRDGGLTWPKEFRLLLDEERSAGYSCMSMIDEETVGILYEGSQAHMTFQRIPLKDILGQAQDSRPNQAKPNNEAGKQQIKLSLPWVFGDHMVLQAGKPIHFWGTATPNSRVDLQLGKEKKSVAADATGNWKATLAPRPVNKTGQVVLVESAGEKVAFQDVLIGEVWLCAGQSNMEWMLKQSTHGANEIVQLEKDPASVSPIRLLDLTDGPRGTFGDYTGEQLARLEPQSFCRGTWQVATSESAPDFSAVGWYFARKLEQELDVPVGLICPAVGGSPTEAWIPVDAIRQTPSSAKLIQGNWLQNPALEDFCKLRGAQNLLSAIQQGESISSDENGPHHPFKPGFLWDAAIKPLLPLEIKGVLWYQGESNAESAWRVKQHALLFPLLINQWRARWERPDLPFLYVQLPAMDRPHWPEFREGQRQILNQLENLGMAVTIDTGLERDVHPPLKQPVGERLANLAIQLCYPRIKATPGGPLFTSVELSGNSIFVTFKSVGKGLNTADNSPPRHFEISGGDGTFYPATAEIVAKDKVKVSHPAVSTPTTVRYAWVPFPKPPVNLFNSAGIPASPFGAQNR